MPTPSVRETLSYPDAVSRRLVLVLSVVLLLVSAQTLAHATEQVARDAGTVATGLQAAIGGLGSLDYATRTNAARTIRRAPAPEAVAALMAAVKDSPDQFIRYRALVLLTAFGDPRMGTLMQAVTSDRNDRLREVAYRWMATRPQTASAMRLLAALQNEQAEFVRPALVRALASVAVDPQVQRALVAEVARGLDFFRLGVIDALGEFKAVFARDAIIAVAKVEGPLQDDAVLALGRIGDQRDIETLSKLPPAAPEVAPALQAAMCLLGSDCEMRLRAIAEMVGRPGERPEVVRGAVTALAVLGASGSDGALSTLTDLAGKARAREDAIVGLGGAALRNPDRVLAWLVHVPSAQQGGLVDLLHSAFERFEEDFSEEQFFAAARAAYWRAAEDSSERTLMASLIQKLEF